MLLISGHSEFETGLLVPRRGEKNCQATPIKEVLIPLRDGRGWGKDKIKIMQGKVTKKIMQKKWTKKIFLQSELWADKQYTSGPSPCILQFSGSWWNPESPFSLQLEKPTLSLSTLIQFGGDCRVPSTADTWYSVFGFARSTTMK